MKWCRAPQCRAILWSPSQLYEHWLEVPEVLKTLRRMPKQAMPETLLNKVLGAATFDMGFQTVEYVASAMVDLDYHTQRRRGYHGAPN